MRRVYFSIFLVSSSALIFEISLTRLFSIQLWYHFAFLVISIAMLGIGSAGTFLAIRARIRGRRPDHFHKGDLFKNNLLLSGNAGRDFFIYAFMSGISFTVCYLLSQYIPFDPARLSWEKMQIFYLALYCLVLGAPFFFSGAFIVSAFFRFSGQSGNIYGSDLLGAGIGSMVVLFLLNAGPPEYAVLTSSVLSLTGSFFIGGKQARVLSLSSIVIIMALMVVHPGIVHLKISDYKRLSLYLKYPGSEHIKTYHSAYSQVDIFKSPAIRFAPGLSLKYLDPLPRQTGIAVDGDRIDALTSSADTANLKFLEFLPSSAAYQIGTRKKVMIIDPGGGLHLLLARHHGARDIFGLESNPAIVDMIKNDPGHLYANLYYSNILAGYARNFLENQSHDTDVSALESGDLYDLIDVTMTGLSVSGAFGISEDYGYTVEAFEKYLNALEKNGILSISLYLLPPPRTEYRLLATIAYALNNLGIGSLRESIIAIRSWDSMTMIVKKTPFSREEIAKIRSFSENKRFDFLYFPGITEKDVNHYIITPAINYYEGFKNIINPQTRASFIGSYLFDISPVHDENPFFHYYLKLRNIKAIYKTMGGKWLYFLQEGYLLPVIFIILLLLTVLIILLPASFYGVSGGKVSHAGLLRTLSYFAFLGLAFMFVEISLIQKGILMLENPSYSVAVVLTSILIGSGAGSMVSEKFSGFRTTFVLIILTAMLITYSLMTPHTIKLLKFPLFIRIICISVAMLPLGFFMGIPFPAGIRLIGKKSSALIPWAWAVNACFSVVAPVLSTIIAISAGFQTVLLLASLLYFFALLSHRRILSNVKCHSGLSGIKEE